VGVAVATKLPLQSTSWNSTGILLPSSNSAMPSFSREGENATNSSGGGGGGGGGGLCHLRTDVPHDRRGDVVTYHRAVVVDVVRARGADAREIDPALVG